MRFSVAAALILSSHVASADGERLANKVVTRNNQQNSIRGQTQRDTPRNGSRETRQPQKPIAKRLIRRLANKRKEQALQSIPHLPENDAESVLPDLGVIGNQHQDIVQNRHRRRALKESIISKDSIRNPFRGGISDSSDGESEDEIAVYTETVLDELQQWCNRLSNDVVSNDEVSNDEATRCDCANFDFKSINGTAKCTYSDSDGSDFCRTTTNYCGEPVEICYRQSISFEATNPQNYSYTYCQTYTAPYQQHVCITFDHLDEYEDSYEDNNSTVPIVDPDESGFTSFTESSLFPCSVQFNDKECNSCSTQIETTQQNYFNEETGESEIISIYQKRCFLIDCSNTGDETNIVNTCNSGSSPTTLKDNVIFGEDCTRCQPCGLGHRVKNLDAEGLFPLIGEYECSGLELAAKIGFFDRKFCPEVQEKTAEYCGCEPIFYDPALIWSPSEPTPRIDVAPPPSTKGIGPVVLLPGNTIGDKTCDVCGSRKAIVAHPNAIVTLPNGVMTSCSALQGAGRLGMFTPDYCQKEVMPLVFLTCGGCYHDQEEYFLYPETVLPQPILEEEGGGGVETNEEEGGGEETEAVTKEEEEENIPFTSSTPNFVVGDGIVSCHICESGSELAMPNNLFTLSNEEISCQNFENRLKNTALTEEFCLEEASAIADVNCGGCVAKQPTTSTRVNNDSLTIISSRRIDGENNRKPMHEHKPEEIDVKSDPLAKIDTNDTTPPPNTTPKTVVSANTSSSQSLTKASKTWIAVSATLAMSYSFVLYFS